MPMIQIISNLGASGMQTTAVTTAVGVAEVPAIAESATSFYLVPAGKPKNDGATRQTAASAAFAATTMIASAAEASEAYVFDPSSPLPFIGAMALSLLAVGATVYYVFRCMGASVDLLNVLDAEQRDITAERKEMEKVKKDAKNIHGEVTQAACNELEAVMRQLTDVLDRRARIITETESKIGIGSFLFMLWRTRRWQQTFALQVSTNELFHLDKIPCYSLFLSLRYALGNALNRAPILHEEFPFLSNEALQQLNQLRTEDPLACAFQLKILGQLQAEMDSLGKEIKALEKETKPFRRSAGILDRLNFNVFAQNTALHIAEQIVDVTEVHGKVVSPGLELSAEAITEAFNTLKEAREELQRVRVLHEEIVKNVQNIVRSLEIVFGFRKGDEPSDAPTTHVGKAFQTRSRRPFKPFR